MWTPAEERVRKIVRTLMETPKAQVFFRSIIEETIERARIEDLRKLDGMAIETFIENEIAVFLKESNGIQY